MNQREITFNLDDISEAAVRFLDSIGENRVIIFDGEMGAGKTTFISEICRQMGAEDDLGSPTFSILNEYASRNGSPIYHFDFYRLEDPREALDIGVEDYFYSGYPCFIEWPERIGNLIPEDALTVKISTLPDGSRKIKF